MTHNPVEPAPQPDSGRRFGLRLSLVVIVTLLLLSIWTLRNVILLVFAAGLLAIAFYRGAFWLRRLTGGPHRLMVAVVLLLTLTVLGLLGLLFGNQIADQVEGLRQRLPAIREAFQGLLARFGFAGVTVGDVMQQLRSSADQLVGPASVVLSGGAAVLGGVFLIVFVAVFLAGEPEPYRDGLIRLFPPHRRERLREVLAEATRILARWLFYQAVSSSITGTITGVGLWLLGVPLAGLLGLLTGLLGFVPIIGSVLGAILAVLVALTVDPVTALWVAVFSVAVQQFEGNVLIPVVQGEGVDLPPALILVGVLGFGTLLGIPGTILALPLLLVGRVFVERLYIEDVLEHRGSIPPPDA